MSEPTPLRMAAVEPVAEVVGLLVLLLAKAEAGELRELAVATRVIGCQVGTAHVGEKGEDVFRMLGAATLLQLRVAEGLGR